MFTVVWLFVVLGVWGDFFFFFLVGGEEGGGREGGGGSVVLPILMTGPSPMVAITVLL